MIKIKRIIWIIEKTNYICHCKTRILWQ